MKFADSLFAGALALAQAPINLANSLLDRITNSETLKLLKSMVEDKVRQVLAEAVFDPCEAAKVAPDILQALEALQRLADGTLQWDARSFQRSFKDYLLRRSPSRVEMAEVIAMLEGFANYMWLAERACERAVAKLLKKEDPLRRTVPAESAGSAGSASSAGTAGTAGPPGPADLALPVLDRQRYLIPIVVPMTWTEKDQFDFLRNGLLRVAAYSKRFAVDQQAAIEATRHEGGKVYGPLGWWELRIEGHCR